MNELNFKEALKLMKRIDLKFNQNNVIVYFIFRVGKIPLVRVSNSNISRLFTTEKNKK